MAFPSARFVPAAGDVLGLRVPAELDRLIPANPTGEHISASATPSLDPRPLAPHQLTGGQAVELERVVPPSGNLWLAGHPTCPRPPLTPPPLPLFPLLAPR